MSVEIAMTRESFDCLEKPVPEGLAERMEAPPVFLHGSGTAPHQVVLNCILEVAEELLALARPSCGPAAEDLTIAIPERLAKALGVSLKKLIG